MSCGPRSRRSREAARAAGVEMVAGDTKVVERGHADGMYICTTGLGRRDRACEPRARPTSGPAIGSCCREASASTAWRSCSRAANSSSTPRSSRTPAALWPAVDALLDAAGPELRCMRDATRGGVASVLNELARASSVCDARARERHSRASGGGGCGGDPRDRPDVRGQRGQAGRVRRARGAPTARWRRCGRCRGCEQAAEIGEVRTEPPGMVLVRDELRRHGG